MSLVRLLTRANSVAGDQPAVALGHDAMFDFAELGRRCAALAGYLSSDLGLQPGARVAILMKNVPEYVEVLFACWQAGLIAVPMNAKLHAREYAYMLRHSAAETAFVTPDLETTLSEAADEASDLKAMIRVGSPDYQLALQSDAAPVIEVGPQDVAWLFYTSGTTGRPKGAMLTHRNLLAMAASYFIDIDSIAPDDCIVHAAPLSHGSGLYMVPHMAAMACQVLPESGGFNPGEIISLAQSYAGITMFAAPTMVHRLVHDDRAAVSNLDGLKTVVYGGAPMHVADVKAALDVLGPKLAQLYGQGESPMCITGLAKRYYADRNHPRWEERIGSAGYAQTVVDVRVVDPDGIPLPPGLPGEICVRGDPVMKGYWEDAEATEQALKDGWLHTGDIGAFDEDGFLTLMDRSKDLIISGGSNIYPREVEEVLLRHAAVSEVSVVGRPHPDWGEEVVAFVTTHEDASVSEQALDDLCQAHIARFKRPKAYRFVEELPKSNYGKILKRELRELSLIHI